MKFIVDLEKATSVCVKIFGRHSSGVRYRPWNDNPWNVTRTWHGGDGMPVEIQKVHLVVEKHAYQVFLLTL